MSSGQDKPEGYVFGRPTKYKPEYCQQLIDHMSQGLSYETFAATINADRATIYRWEADFPDFCDAKKKAFDKCQIWWEKVGVSGLWGNREGMFNSAVWIFNMKNRFKWTDKVEVEQSTQGTIKLAYSKDE